MKIITKMRKFKMRLNKKILLYEVASIISGCMGALMLGAFLMIGLFSRWTLAIDLIWIALSFILIFVWYFTNKYAYKLQKRWDYEHRR
jgi:sterol desaturase/sphingolipid hydroxylase (fatty acid hydroxylase superfamily)